MVPYKRVIHPPASNRRCNAGQKKKVWKHVFLLGEVEMQTAKNSCALHDISFIRRLYIALKCSAGAQNHRNCVPRRKNIQTLYQINPDTIFKIILDHAIVLRHVLTKQCLVAGSRRCLGRQHACFCAQIKYKVTLICLSSTGSWRCERDRNGHCASGSWNPCNKIVSIPASLIRPACVFILSAQLLHCHSPPPPTLPPPNTYCHISVLLAYRKITSRLLKFFV